MIDQRLKDELFKAAMTPEGKLSKDYLKGFRAAAWLFAIWHDGLQVCGVATLFRDVEDTIAELLKEGNLNGVVEGKA